MTLSPKRKAKIIQPLPMPQERVIMNIPWVDKYRPKTLAEIVGNKDTINKLIAMGKSGDFPNMSLIGPPGTGKTTAAKALINDTFKGRGTYKILNASDERGIKVVQTKIKEFASHRSIGSKIKVWILDEAEKMSDDAQTALREVIGQNQKNCRFILTANEGGKLIEAILSRCPPLPFEKLLDADVLSVLQRIATQEKKQVSPEALSEIVVDAEGDLRTAINRLQIACTGTTGEVGEEDTRFIKGFVVEKIEAILVVALTRPFGEALGAWLAQSIYTSPRKFLSGSITVVYNTRNPQIDQRLLAEALSFVDWTRGSEECQVLGLLARLNRGSRNG